VTSSQYSHLPGDIDKGPIIDSLERLDTTHSNWMKLNNCYRIKGEEKLKKAASDPKKSTGDPKLKRGDPLTNIKVDEFSEFLSSTALLQCSDAWSLLGRSAGSLLLGDVTSALHMAYYAELRATMSLLAAEGIYIGVNEALYLNRSNGVAFLSRGGTHQIIWPLLEQWRMSPYCTKLMNAIIEPYGTSLQRWSGTAVSNSGFPTLDKIVQAASLDQKYLDTDHDLRNMVSYRPANLEFEAEPDLSLGDSIEVITSLWQYLEPGDSTEFPAIDDELLRDTLVAQFMPFSDDNNDSEPLDDNYSKFDWSAWIEHNSPNSDLSELNRERLKSVQPNEVRSDSKLLNDAKIDAIEATSWIESARGVLSRALMICRFATGAAESLIDNANVDVDFTRTWINSVSLGRGLSVELQDRENAKDLWSDVQLAIDEVNPMQKSNRSELRDKVGKYVLSLSLLERVTVWSFAR
jgi:hypothetical protein